MEERSHFQISSNAYRGAMGRWHGPTKCCRECKVCHIKGASLKNDKTLLCHSLTLQKKCLRVHFCQLKRLVGIGGSRPSPLLPSFSIFVGHLLVSIPPPGLTKEDEEERGDVLSICFWRRRRRMARPTDRLTLVLRCLSPPFPLPLDPPALKGRKRPSSSDKMGLGTFPNFHIHYDLLRFPA